MESNFLKNGTNELFKRQIHRFLKTYGLSKGKCGWGEIN